MGPSFRYTHRHTIERLEDKLQNNPVSSEVIIMNNSNRSPQKNKYPKYLLTGRSSSGSKRVITSKDPSKKEKQAGTLDNNSMRKSKPENTFGHKRNTTN